MLIFSRLDWNYLGNFTVQAHMQLVFVRGMVDVHVWILRVK